MIATPAIVEVLKRRKLSPRIEWTDEMGERHTYYLALGTEISFDGLHWFSLGVAKEDAGT